MAQEWKLFVKNFKTMFIVVAVFALLAGTAWLVSAFKSQRTGGPSTNTERVYGDQRVFDYADALTDAEEDSLEAYIHEKELVTQTDIVIVTLNEPLEFYEVEYRSRYQGIYVGADTPDKWVMVYADKFWEDNKFGYDGPQRLDGTDVTGHGVILVDNFYREGPENKIYTWMGTTGKVKTRFSSDMIDKTLDAFYENVDYNYYEACIDFVDAYSKRMVGGIHYIIPQGFILAITLIILVVYVSLNWHSKAAKVTVTPKTYLVGKEAHIDKKDIYIRTTVTKTKISSSSGGGGGHSSGGGGSHGGGGHSR